MSEHSEQIAKLLAADAPAARDHAFQLAVMAKIEQRRFRRGLVLNVALTLAATLLLAVVMPGLEPLLQQMSFELNSNLAIMALVIASVALPWWVTRRA